MQAVATGKDVDEFGESISNVETVLGNYNIALRDTQHQFRAFGDIMDDIRAQWDDLGTVQQAEIAGAIAGDHYARTYSNIWGHINVFQKLPKSVELPRGQYRDNYFIVI